MTLSTRRRVLLLSPIQVSAIAPDAPTIALNALSDSGASGDGITNDNTPDIDFDLPTTPVAGDQIELQVDLSTIALHTLTQGEIGSGMFVLNTGAVSDGTYALRARHIRGGSPSAWSSNLSVTIDTAAPTITSSATGNNAENSTLAHALTADETVTWSKVGGADQSKFEISGSTLRWTGNGIKDFEAPDDADSNNTYIVTVRATDAAGNTTDQTITVTVTDISESNWARPGAALDLDWQNDRGYVDGVYYDTVDDALDALGASIPGGTTIQIPGGAWLDATTGSFVMKSLACAGASLIAIGRNASSSQFILGTFSTSTSIRVRDGAMLLTAASNDWATTPGKAGMSYDSTGTRVRSDTGNSDSTTTVFTSFTDVFVGGSAAGTIEWPSASIQRVIHYAGDALDASELDAEMAAI